MNLHPLTSLSDAELGAKVRADAQAFKSKLDDPLMLSGSLHTATMALITIATDYNGAELKLSSDNVVAADGMPRGNWEIIIRRKGAKL